MLFLWTITKRGKIWLDGDAFKQIVSKRLPPDFYCQEVSFVGDQNLLNIYIVLPEKDDPQKRLALMDKFEEFFKPMGIAVHVHWTRRAPDDLPGARTLWQKPLAWAAAAGGVVGLANLGLRGIIWVAIAAILGYGISWFALSDEGRGIIARLIKEIKEFRR